MPHTPRLLSRCLTATLLTGLALSTAAPASAAWDTVRVPGAHPVLHAAPGSSATASAPRTARPAAPAKPTPAATPSSSSSSSPSSSEAAAYQAEVLRLVNVERARAGLAALRADSCAATYAARQNRVIATSGTLSHQDLGAVMRGCQARGAGENVAYGNVSAAQMMVMWMNSPGHRANILRPSFTHLGVGASKTANGRWYGTQVFLTR